MCTHACAFLRSWRSSWGGVGRGGECGWYWVGLGGAAAAVGLKQIVVTTCCRQLGSSFEVHPFGRFPRPLRRRTPSPCTLARIRQDSCLRLRPCKSEAHAARPRPVWFMTRMRPRPSQREAGRCLRAVPPAAAEGDMHRAPSARSLICAAAPAVAAQSTLAITDGHPTCGVRRGARGRAAKARSARGSVRSCDRAWLGALRARVSAFACARARLRTNERGDEPRGTLRGAPAAALTTRGCPTRTRRAAARSRRRTASPAARQRCRGGQAEARAA